MNNFYAIHIRCRFFIADLVITSTDRFTFQPGGIHHGF